MMAFISGVDLALTRMRNRSHPGDPRVADVQPPYAGQTLGAEQDDRYAFQSHTPTAGGAVRQLLFPRTQHLFPDFAVVIEGNGRHEETRTPDLYRVKSSATRLVLACREVLPCGGSSSAVRGAHSPSQHKTV